MKGNSSWKWITVIGQLKHRIFRWWESNVIVTVTLITSYKIWHLRRPGSSLWSLKHSGTHTRCIAINIHPIIVRWQFPGSNITECTKYLLSAMTLWAKQEYISGQNIWHLNSSPKYTMFELTNDSNSFSNYCSLSSSYWCYATTMKMFHLGIFTYPNLPI